MTDPEVKMFDLAFEISGDNLPAYYPYSLWDELRRLAPELSSSELTGVVPLRLAEGQTGLQLPKRTRMTLRISAELIDSARKLEHQPIVVAGCKIQLGGSKLKELQHFPTLHAHLVQGNEDEVSFINEVEAALTAMSVKASVICGQRRSFSDGQRETRGYSLVLHDLTPAGSLLLQSVGLGANRSLGCGLFVPHKTITSFE